MPYAVAIGRERKVVETWAEYKRLTEGYPGAKGRKVNSYEEGLEYIDSVLKESVINLGYETPLTSRRSTIPYISTLTNCFVTIRSMSKVTYTPYPTVTIKVFAIVSTLTNLPLAELSSETKWDKRNRYLITEEFSDAGITDKLAYIKFLTMLLKFLRRNCGELSLTVNTESNYIVHLLMEDITEQYDVISESAIMYENEIRVLYSEVTTMEGLHLNYESSRQVSSDGSFLNNIMRKETSIE